MPEGTPGRYAVRTLVRFGVLSVMGLTLLLILSALLLRAQMGAQLRWSDHTQKVRALLSTLERNLLQAESAFRAFMYAGDEGRLRDFELVERLAGQLDRLETEVSDNPEQASRLDQLRRLIEAKVAFLSRGVALKRGMREAELRNLLAGGEGLRLAQEIHNKAVEMDSVEARLLTNRRGAVDRSKDGLNILLLFGMSVELLVGFSVLSFLGRRLAPLRSAVALAEKVGKGELAVDPLEIRVDDEVGRVNSNLNLMLAQLRETARQNQSMADTLNQVTARMAHSSKEQAAALQQQSTALQQTSVTLEQLTQSANQIAERSLEVASRADATAEAAGAGLDAVRRSALSTGQLVDQVRTVAERVHALGGKTDSIRGIVLTVNDIADRSHVLALNAAILAAGAGGSDQGFTSVALEMKSLAEQSKEATVQVRDLLGEIERGIQAAVVFIEEAARRGTEGSAFTDEASVSIQQLHAQVRDSALAFSQITAATSQQKLAFEQVAEALTSIHGATIQSTSTTLGLEKTTGELHRLSAHLLELIGGNRRS
jgi:methyl-accepting chemotaxis protein